jgi:HNH endonuclease
VVSAPHVHNNKLAIDMRSRASDVCRPLSNIIVVGQCWEWNACRFPSGYGKTSFDGKQTGAHRASFAAFVGDPTGKSICHRCDNKPCIRPSHLFAGTAKDNAHDASAKGLLCRRGKEGKRNKSLTSYDVYFMKLLFSRGWTPKRAASYYGVSKSLTEAIRRGRVWSDIHCPHAPVFTRSKTSASLRQHFGAIAS